MKNSESENEIHRIAFPSNGSSIKCPVCGYKAKVIRTDAARSWAEICCENCSTYGLFNDALNGVSASDLPLLSGYYRHVYHEPMTMQCDNKTTVIDHIKSTRNEITRDRQIKSFLDHHYQKVNGMGQFVSIDHFPAIAYANDENDYISLIDEAYNKGYIRAHGDEISVTELGLKFMREEDMRKKPTVFISYNWGNKKLAEQLENCLQPHANVKRDDTSVQPWGDLQSFMKSIRNQDFAVLIISDAYLKSEACLFEVMELMEEQRWDKRVMYIVTDDAHGIYDAEIQLEYIKYWAKKAHNLNDKIKELNPAATTAQSEELRKLQFIAAKIGNFMAKVKQSKNPDIDIAIHAVVERVRS